VSTKPDQAQGGTIALRDDDVPSAVDHLVRLQQPELSVAIEVLPGSQNEVRVVIPVDD
jgi:hypothetical protein